MVAIMMVRITTLLAVLLITQSAWSLTDHLLSLKRSCQLSYTVQDMYNVTMQDLGSDCSKGSAHPMHARGLFPGKGYYLIVKPTETGRDVNVNWEYFGCYTEFYMKFEVSFHPGFWIDDSQRKCIRLTVEHISNKLPLDIVRLHFNCLQINSKDMGTLSIQSYGDPTPGSSCPSEQSHKTFDLGCSINKTQAWFLECLTVAFSGLHPHTDYGKTRIVLHGPGSCTRTFSGLRMAQEILFLPVYGNGSYYVEINLVCNASGEVEERTIFLNTTVKDAYTCQEYKPTPPLGCIHSTTHQLQTPISPPMPSYSQLYTVISVVFGIGTVAVVVVIVFIKRKQQLNNAGDLRCQYQQPSETSARNTENRSQTNPRALETTDVLMFEDSGGFPDEK